MSKRPALGSLDKNVNGTTDTPPPTKPSTTTVPEKRPSVMTTDIENNQPTMTPAPKYKWKTGDRGDENNCAPPRFHPPPPSHTRPHPTSSPYPFYPYPGAYPQPQQSYMYPSPHHLQHRQPQTPYMYSPTPTLSYSPYESRGPSATKKRSTTPTPSSRTYRSFQSGSSRQSVTTPSIKTPFHSHQPTTPASAGGTAENERILLPKPQFNGTLPILSGIEPNAMWPLHEGPPPLYLEGEDGKEVPTPEHMNQSEAERWSKLSKDSNKFRSHNPWDYIAPDSRQQFSPSQRVVLESLWILTCTPCPKERERIAVWMGVSTSRITIFFQNRRQGIVKSRNTPGLEVPMWPESAAERHCDPHAWWANGTTRSCTIMSSGEDEHYFGMIKLNNDRGYLDDNGKWASFDGDVPLAPAEYMEKLPILYSIIRGNLDHLFFYHQYTAGSPRSSTDSVFTPVYNAQMPPKWFDTMMLDREAGIPSGSKRRIQPEYDDEGNIRNLANLLPTDPPSESPVPMKRRTSGSVRGERCPEFAMRATSPVQFGRASGRSLYWSSQRAQHLATMGNGTASLGRTQSLPSIPQVRSSASKPKPHTRPSIAMKPRNSFARSQSTADIDAGSPPMKMARREKGKKCFMDDASPTMSAVSEEEGIEEVKAAETLLGFSRSSASVSVSSKTSSKDEKLNE